MPFFNCVAGMAQCCEQRFSEALVSQFSVEAVDEAILPGLSWRDEMPIDARFLHPVEDRHAGELSAVARHGCLRHAGSAMI
ncbi:hypothetical protein [Phaeobacter sp. S60]|uniref:hypothetical protein n=1 Tax=Phaeobacter sp. S60 TaxID=1569353 RepID=UPI001F518B3D|nr:MULTISPECIES: hypothetical protein [Phaeobacter]